MNRLNSQQRKLAYLVGIVALLIPIIWLGMPATGEEGSGGQLARLRHEYDLGESTLGEVDPSSATMNLVLLGLRGVATNLLWLEADELKNTKNWAQLRATVDSIIMLQPYFLKVWRFQGWNLAYNVSAEWDAVEDRYYWVKEGGKFLQRGSERNRKPPELCWDTGTIMGNKIGRSDEWAFFRQFFKSDPDPDFNGGPDLEINPDGRDNYLVAKEWYRRANDRELNYSQSIMARVLFRHYPARAQFDYANSLQREGIFEEVTRIAWEQAYRDWTEDFGQEPFQSPGGEIRLEASEADILALAEKDNVDPETKKYWVGRYQDMANYRYWKVRALSESEPETVQAHREIYEGKKLFSEGKYIQGPDGSPSEAQVMLESGLRKFENLLERYPMFVHEDLAIEEGLMGLLYWRYIHQLNEQPIPPNFPLQQLWTERQDRIPELDDQFRRESGIR